VEKSGALCLGCGRSIVHTFCCFFYSSSFFFFFFFFPLNNNNKHLFTGKGATPTSNPPSSHSDGDYNRADAGQNLVIKTNSIAPGSSDSFSFAYVLAASDLTLAMENLNTLSITQPPGQLHQCDRTKIVLACSIDGTFTSATVEFSVMRNGAIETAFSETVTSPVKTGTKSYVVTQDWSDFGTFKWLRVSSVVNHNVLCCTYVLLYSFFIFQLFRYSKG
jgi:hypothetical protein